MQIIDLTDFGKDRFTVHYGGKLNEVNANTFANSLLCLSSIIDEINQEVNPDFTIELRVEALAPGSFRPNLKLVRKNISSLLKGLVKREQIIPILISLLALKQAGGPNNVEIIIKEDTVKIESPTKRVIIPKTTYNYTTNTYNNINIHNFISQHYSILDSDDSITDFGIAEDDKSDIMMFEAHRDEFTEMSKPEVCKDPETCKTEIERIKIQVIKPILEKKSVNGNSYGAV